jgi:transposase
MGAQKVSHMGLDCHKNFSRVTARDEQGRIVWRGRLEHGDRQQLRAKLASWPKVPVVLEGTFGWGWISDELAAAGQEPHLANSRKTAGWRDARGMAKSNRIDSDLLSELWTEKQRWWEIWLAPAEVRDQREWLRYRMSLVRVQTGIKNRIHAILHRHGILQPFSDLFGKHGLAWLKELLEDPEMLRESAKQTLEGYLKLLKQFRQQIAAVTREMRRQVRRNPAGELWRSLPGVSFILAYSILAEVGQISRFANGRHLSSYSLLAPLADDSGDEGGPTAIGRHVGKLGRVTLKWAFIQAARRAAVKSEYFKAIFNRRTDNGQRDRQRGYIAVARELSRVGYSCLKNQRRFIEERPERPEPRRPESKPQVAAPEPQPAEIQAQPAEIQAQPTTRSQRPSPPEVRRARSPLGRRREKISRPRASL